LLAAVVALAACGGGSDGKSTSTAGGISDQHHREYVAGCTNAGPSAAVCECVFQQLTTKQGLNTEAKFSRMLAQLQAASASGPPAFSALPKELQAATVACKSSGGA
jgi:hypothetical protein